MISLNINQILTDHQNSQLPSYSSVHNWLRKKYGAACQCENIQCANPSLCFQWAKVKDKEYDYKRENFIMLCGRCHYYYDEKFRRYQKIEVKNQAVFEQLQLFIEGNQ